MSLREGEKRHGEVININSRASAARANAESVKDANVSEGGTVCCKEGSGAPNRNRKYLTGGGGSKQEKTSRSAFSTYVGSRAVR